MLIGFIIVELFFGGIGVWAIGAGETALGNSLLGVAFLILITGISMMARLSRNPMPEHEEKIRSTKYDGLAVILIVIIVAIVVLTQGG